MSRRVSRRTVLSLGTTLAATSLTGCSTRDPADGGEGSGNRGTILAVAPRASDDPPLNPIRVETLPDEEREAVREAIETGVYHLCPDGEGSRLGEFKRRLSSRPMDNTYLDYRGSYYQVRFQVSDEVFAYTAPAPPENRLSDCG